MKSFKRKLGRRPHVVENNGSWQRGGAVAHGRAASGNPGNSLRCCAAIAGGGRRHRESGGGDSSPSGCLLD